MLDLSRKLTDELVLGDDVYPMNIAFNKVLKVVELINDGDIDELYKPYLAIQIFTGVDFTQALSPEQATAIFKLIFEEHIRIIPENITSKSYRNKPYIFRPINKEVSPFNKIRNFLIYNGTS